MAFSPLLLLLDEEPQHPPVLYNKDSQFSNENSEEPSRYFVVVIFSQEIFALWHLLGEAYPHLKFLGISLYSFPPHMNGTCSAPINAKSTSSWQDPLPSTFVSPPDQHSILSRLLCSAMFRHFSPLTPQVLTKANFLVVCPSML